MQSQLSRCRVSVLGGLAFLVVLLAAVPAGAADQRPDGKDDGIILPCENSVDCNPEPPCIPNIFHSRVVTNIVYLHKKPNGVCVYECTANETFTDLNHCLEPNTIYGDIFRARIFAGDIACPPASAAFCCDTDVRPDSCSW